MNPMNSAGLTDFELKLQKFKGLGQGPSVASPDKQPPTKVLVAAKKVLFEGLAEEEEKQRRSSHKKREYAAPALSPKPKPPSPLVVVAPPLPLTPKGKEPIENEAIIEKLNGINKVLDEKDETTHNKRQGNYYLAQVKGQLVWKPLDLEERWKKKEQKEICNAIKYIIKVFNAAHVQGIREIPGTEEHFSKVLNRILDREWFLSLKNDWRLEKKDFKRLRQSIIKCFYRLNYNDIVSSSQEIKKFITESRTVINNLVLTLGSLQRGAVTREVAKMVEVGKGIVVSKPPTQPSAPKFFKPVDSIRVSQNLRDRVTTTRRQLIELKEANAIYRKEEEFNREAYERGIDALEEKERLAVAQRMGVASAYGQQGIEILKSHIIQKPDTLLGAFNEKNPKATELTVTLQAYEENLETFLKFHQDWLESGLRIRKFRNRFEGDKLSKIKASYKSGDYGNTLAILLHQNDIHTVFQSILKHLFAISCERLQQSGVEPIWIKEQQRHFKKALERYPFVDWQIIDTLLKRVLGKFRELHLA